jgi:hypothetical protein
VKDFLLDLGAGWACIAAAAAIEFSLPPEAGFKTLTAVFVGLFIGIATRIIRELQKEKAP